MVSINSFIEYIGSNTPPLGAFSKRNPARYPAVSAAGSGFIEFLEKLEREKVYYELDKIRDDTIMVKVVVPGQIWEIEYNTYGDDSKCVIEIEKFISTGTMYDEKELDVLFRDFPD